jgi:hypothetical protein
MIIKLTKNHKTANGKVLKAGKVIETSKGHEYKDFEVLAKSGHFGSPSNSGLKAKLAAAENVSTEVKTIKKIKEENNGSK